MLERIGNLTEVCKDFQFPAVEYPDIGKEKNIQKHQIANDKISYGSHESCNSTNVFSHEDREVIQTKN